VGLTNVQRSLPFSSLRFTSPAASLPSIQPSNADSPFVGDDTASFAGSASDLANHSFESCTTTSRYAALKMSQALFLTSARTRSTSCWTARLPTSFFSPNKGPATSSAVTFGRFSSLRWLNTALKLPDRLSLARLRTHVISSAARNAECKRNRASNSRALEASRCARV